MRTIGWHVRLVIGRNGSDELFDDTCLPCARSLRESIITPHGIVVMIAVESVGRREMVVTIALVVTMPCFRRYSCTITIGAAPTRSPGCRAMRAGGFELALERLIFLGERRGAILLVLELETHTLKRLHNILEFIRDNDGLSARLEHFLIEFVRVVFGDGAPGFGARECLSRRTELIGKGLNFRVELSFHVMDGLLVVCSGGSCIALLRGTSKYLFRAFKFRARHLGVREAHVEITLHGFRLHLGGCQVGLHFGAALEQFRALIS